jgi:hypothetical protein
MSYRAIKRLLFGCTRVFGPFLDAPTAHDVTQDCKFFVVDGWSAPLEVDGFMRRF